MIKMEVIAKTREVGAGEDTSLMDLRILGGKLAGICYMPDDYCSNAIQDVVGADKRAGSTAKSGHHSVQDHGNITVLIQGIPKMVVMILNSTQYYTTSEKSARYTRMADITGYEKFFYDKWAKILAEKIKEKYTKIDDVAANKLAQENARYMTSVFTPTVMAYTTSYRQLNYLVDWCDKLVDSLDKIDGRFNKILCEHVKELREAIMGVLGVKVLTDNKDRYFELLPMQHGIQTDAHENHFGDVYSTEYRMSLAALAQAQRHRTINYQMLFSGTDALEYGFYVPKIIRDDVELTAEWLKDIGSMAENFPQGTLVDVIEQGMAKDFVLKCKERLCGRAQLEIMQNTVDTLGYFEHPDKPLSRYNQHLFNNMTYDGTVPKCGFKDYKCAEPCIWGITEGLTRLI